MVQPNPRPLSRAVDDFQNADSFTSANRLKGRGAERLFVGYQSDMIIERGKQSIHQRQTAIVRQRCHSKAQTSEAKDRTPRKMPKVPSPMPQKWRTVCSATTRN